MKWRFNEGNEPREPSHVVIPGIPPNFLPVPAGSPTFAEFPPRSSVRALMTPRRLDNYLRSHRKQSGLSQDEVAFLLGVEHGSLLSRYEKRRRLPPLETALACEAVFGVPISELFAGIRERAGLDVAKRRAELKTRLQGVPRKGSGAQMKAHKLRWLSPDSSVGNEPISVS